MRGRMWGRRKGGTKGILDAGRGESEEAIERAPERWRGEAWGFLLLVWASLCRLWVSERRMLTLDLNWLLSLKCVSPFLPLILINGHPAATPRRFPMENLGLDEDLATIIFGGERLVAGKERLLPQSTELISWKIFSSTSFRCLWDNPPLMRSSTRYELICKSMQITCNSSWASGDRSLFSMITLLGQFNGGRKTTFTRQVY